MKKVKALDQIVENGRIQQDEFDRLFEVGVLAAAAEAPPPPPLLLLLPQMQRLKPHLPPMRQRHQRRTRRRHRQQTQPQPHLLRLRRLQHPSKQWLAVSVGRRSAGCVRCLCVTWVMGERGWRRKFQRSRGIDKAA